MKTKIGKVVLAISMAIAAIFTQKAHGGTAHVFCQYLGNIASPSQTGIYGCHNDNRRLPRADARVQDVGVGNSAPL